MCTKRRINAFNHSPYKKAEILYMAELVYEIRNMFISSIFHLITKVSTSKCHFFSNAWLKNCSHEIMQIISLKVFLYFFLILFAQHSSKLQNTKPSPITIYASDVQTDRQSYTKTTNNI